MCTSVQEIVCLINYHNILSDMIFPTENHVLVEFIWWEKVWSGRKKKLYLNFCSCMFYLCTYTHDNLKTRVTSSHTQFFGYKFIKNHPCILDVQL